jgi:hypothetical protein
LHSERRDKKLKHVYSESTAYEGNWRKQAITLIDPSRSRSMSVMAIFSPIDQRGRPKVQNPAWFSLKIQSVCLMCS